MNRTIIFKGMFLFIFTMLCGGTIGCDEQSSTDRDGDISDDADLEDTGGDSSPDSEPDSSPDSDPDRDGAVDDADQIPDSDDTDPCDGITECTAGDHCCPDGCTYSGGDTDCPDDTRPIVCKDALRDIDFETGDFSQITSGDHVGDSTVVSDPPAHSGTYSARLSAPPKADLRLWSLPSDDLWYSYWFYLPEDWNGDTRWQMLAEWCPGVAPFCDIHALIGFHDHSGIENNIYFYTTWGVNEHSGVSLPEGRWVNIQAYTHWDMTDGEIVVWMDGAEILRYTGRTLMYPESPDRISHEVGSYRDPGYAPHPFYLDDVLICPHAF